MTFQRRNQGNSIFVCLQFSYISQCTAVSSMAPASALEPGPRAVRMSTDCDGGSKLSPHWPLPAMDAFIPYSINGPPQICLYRFKTTVLFFKKQWNDPFIRRSQSSLGVYSFKPSELKKQQSDCPPGKYFHPHHSDFPFGNNSLVELLTTL